MKNRVYPELAAALREMVDAIDSSVVSGGYSGGLIDMYLAGGMAVNYYCGTRYTRDVNASFSKRLLLPISDLVVAYMDREGSPASLYFDGQYNAAYAVLHENFEIDALPWAGFGNEVRVIQLKVLAPVDLATSNLARFLAHDQQDILALAEAGLINTASLRARTIEALGCFVGNPQPVMTSLGTICGLMGGLRHPDRERSRG